MNNDLIVTDSGEPTELTAPNFGDGLTFLNPAEMPDLEQAEAGMSIEPKYLEFKSTDQKIRAIFNGMTTIKTKNRQTGELEDKPAIVLQSRDGIFLNAGASLVNQMNRLRPGTPVEVKYLGTERTASGNNVNKFDVRMLNIGTSRPRVEGKPKQDKSITDYVTAFWSRAKELNLSDDEAKSVLKNNGGSFANAYEAISNSPFEAQ